MMIGRCRSVSMGYGWRAVGDVGVIFQD